MITNPSQYQCDIISKNEIILFNKRSIFYKLKRFLFYKNKEKITFMYNGQKTTKYQEDCFIVDNAVNQCTINIDNLSYSHISSFLKLIKNNVFKKANMNLYSLNLEFKNGEVLIIPLNEIEKAININKNKLNFITEQRDLKDKIKFFKFDGNHYRKIAQIKNIRTWCPSYCVLCGKSIKMIFKESTIEIENNCNCGNTNINKKQMTYDDFAMWMQSQNVKNTINFYNKKWNKE